MREKHPGQPQLAAARIGDAVQDQNRIAIGTVRPE